ncbi:hypothetical protein Tco_0857878 [Tanacetum coccineum]|uniref:Uncharacterized protein n=1 Tax=Tanacetum coccineum TaxID=301880 RepID=A0ABQ5B7G9_9ASTR
MFNLHSSQSLRASCQKDLKKGAVLHSIVDPLALLLTPLLQHVPFIILTSSPQPTAQSPNVACGHYDLDCTNILIDCPKAVSHQPKQEQLRTSSNLKRTHATVHDGHIVTEPIQRESSEEKDMLRGSVKNPRRKMDSQYFKDKALLMEDKEERRCVRC